MAEELGRITKPEAEQFKDGRRLFLVPLIFTPPAPPRELQEIVERYWHEALSQINGLEARIGSVKRIYHEMVALDGEGGLSTLGSMNTGSHNLAKILVERGGCFTSVEDIDLLNEFMDWGRCLSTGLYSHKVLNTVLQSYQETQNRRNQEMASRLDKSLGSDEIGLLIVTENHRIQFPSDIEVFYVAPPALDEYKRWLRHQEESYTRAKPQSQDEPEKKAPAKAEKEVKPEAEAGKPAKAKQAASEKPEAGASEGDTPRPARKTRKKKSS